MAIDASIPMGVQPIEIPSPINAFAKVQQLQGLQQQNALNAMAMQEKQRAIEDEAALNRVYSQAYDPSGNLDKNRLFSGLASANLGSKIPTAQKLLSEQEKSTLETQKLGLENAAKRVNTMASLMMDVNDQSSYDWARREGARLLGEDAVAHLPLMFNPLDIKHRISQAMSVNERIQQQQKEIETKLNREKFDWQRQHESAVLAETRRAHNLTDARAREQISQGKVPSGYRAMADGTLEPIPGGPADKLGEKQTNQLSGVNNLLDAIQNYQDKLKNFGLKGYLSPDARAVMGTYYNNMMLQAKEAYNLGVLNGPDYAILTSMITDPTSGKGLIVSKTAMDSQATELAKIMRKIGQNVSQRRPKLNPEEPGGAPGAGANGMFTDNPFNAPQHPPEIERLLKRY